MERGGGGAYIYLHFNLNTALSDIVLNGDIIVVNDSTSQGVGDFSRLDKFVKSIDEGHANAFHYRRNSLSLAFLVLSL